MSEVITITPSEKFSAVTPSDTALLTYNGELMRTKGIYIGATGNLVVRNDLGVEVAFLDVPTGMTLPISTDCITTATDATDVVALF